MTPFIFAAGLALLLATRTKPKKQLAAPAPPATDADVKKVLQIAMTRESDPRVVLQLGALFMRNMLTVSSSTGVYTFDRRPVYYNMSKLPLRDDLTILPDPSGRNPFGARAFQMMAPILLASAAGDKGATRTLAQTIAQGGK